MNELNSDQIIFDDDETPVDHSQTGCENEEWIDFIVNSFEQ